MQLFEELKAPHEEQKIPGYIGRWYCPNLSHTKFLVVDSSGIELKGLDKRNIDQYFWDTEVEAHEVTAQWYSMFGVAYPYDDEWDAAKQKAGVSSNSGIVKSQVMDFKK